MLGIGDVDTFAHYTRQVVKMGIERYSDEYEESGSTYDGMIVPLDAESAATLMGVATENLQVQIFMDISANNLITVGDRLRATTGRYEDKTFVVNVVQDYTLSKLLPCVSIGAEEVSLV